MPADASRSSATAGSLAENPEVAEEPPKQNENQDGGKTSTAEFLGSVTGGDAAQQLAHFRCSLCDDRCSANAQSVPARAVLYRGGDLTISPECASSLPLSILRDWASRFG